MVTDDTINIAERIAPYLNPDSSVQEESGEILKAVCTYDKNNAMQMFRFLQDYGSKIISLDNNSETTFNLEVKKHFPELLTYDRKID